MSNKKNNSSKNNPLHKKIDTPLICLFAVVAVVILALIFHGWLRETVLPKTVGMFYASDVSATLENQNKTLGDPLTALGFGNMIAKNSCALELAQSIHEEVDCQSLLQGYTVLPHNLQAEEQHASSIQSRLHATGWRSGSNGVTLTSLVSGMAKGIDWSPDANYEKIVGGNKDCVLDVMIAYSNPQPLAIRSTFSCDRTLDLLGTPKGQFYSSSRGHL